MFRLERGIDALSVTKLEYDGHLTWGAGGLSFGAFGWKCRSSLLPVRLGTE